MEDKIQFALSLFFFLYIYNYTLLGSPLHKFIDKISIELKIKKATNFIGFVIGYINSCLFCQSFYISLIFSLLKITSYQYIAVIPILILMIDKFINLEFNK